MSELPKLRLPDPNRFKLPPMRIAHAVPKAVPKAESDKPFLGEGKGAFRNRPFQFDFVLDIFRDTYPGPLEDGWRTTAKHFLSTGNALLNQDSAGYRAAEVYLLHLLYCLTDPTQHTRRRIRRSEPEAWYALCAPSQRARQRSLDLRGQLLRMDFFGNDLPGGQGAEWWLCPKVLIRVFFANPISDFDLTDLPRLMNLVRTSFPYLTW